NLSQAVNARRAEYVRPSDIRIKVGSWNTASLKGTEKDLGSWFVDRRPVGLYVLGLQEVVDLNSFTEALRPFHNSAVAERWKDAVAAALPEGFALVVEQQLVGLLLLVYASEEVRGDVKFVSSTSVGTGIGGLMGNKGAVAARVVIGESTRLVFVNSHMSAGADQGALERRNWDAAQVVSRVRFAPIKDGVDSNSGERIGDEDFAFWFGDLNYRLEGVPAEDVRKLLALHSTEEEEAEESADSAQVKKNIADDEDPTSLQTTLSSLLPHDELQQQMKSRKAFQDGWHEGPITFLPTYKYDVGKVGVFDSSDKKRAPSWCDRILYRTRRDRLMYDKKLLEEAEALKRDNEMKANGTDQAGDDEEILYDYDPEFDGADDEDHDLARVMTKEGVGDEIILEQYAAHQKVVSSDHKPLTATFTLQYDRVVPELKAKVHAEVAKALDRAENESRPNVTVVVDRHQAEASDSEGIIDFGDLEFASVKRRTLTAANTSRMTAKLSFIERPAGDEMSICPNWLTIAVSHSAITTANNHIALEPGECSEVELETHVVDCEVIKSLNNGPAKIEDVLVLRVEGGRDHFISVRAQWLRTSLSLTMDELVRIPEGGVRTVNKTHDDNYIYSSAPRELLRLTEAVEKLTTLAFSEPAQTEPAPWNVNPIWPFREASLDDGNLEKAARLLDTNEPLTDLPTLEWLYTISQLLTLFLTYLPEGIIPPDLWEAILKSNLLGESDLDKARVGIQEILARKPRNAVAFVLVVAMLRRILDE
ncbi:DNase I-like protein, partial [Piedraia hortae CBS 480.64]